MYEVVLVGMVAFTAFSLGTVVRAFVTSYKEYRSPSRSVDAKQRLYSLAFVILSMMAMTGVMINALMRFITSHCS